MINFRVLTCQKCHSGASEPVHAWVVGDWLKDAGIAENIERNSMFGVQQKVFLLSTLHVLDIQDNRLRTELSHII